MQPTESYILCGTPRTGSTFLCALLKSTGVAGIPESYFREPDEPTWATQWGITRTEDGTFSDADLGLRIPAGVTITAPNVRLADEMTMEWMELYRAMTTAEGLSMPHQ